MAKTLRVKIGNVDKSVEFSSEEDAAKAEELVEEAKKTSAADVENAVATLTGLKIKRVLAKMDVVVPGRVLDDNDVILVEYEGGATGCYWTSQFAIGHMNDLRVRIYGENGSILWKQEECEKVTMIDHDGNIMESYRGTGSILPGAAAYGRLPSGHTEGWLESMGNLYKSFINCIQAKKDGTFTEDMIDAYIKLLNKDIERYRMATAPIEFEMYYKL